MIVPCSEAPPDALGHTGLHVLKGAVVRVLGEEAMWTASAHSSGLHGRLTVAFNRKPSREEIERIEEEANAAIERDLPVAEETLPRREAEEKYGRIIYDLFPVPEHVKELTIVIIRDVDGSIWNINACNKLHVDRIGCLGSLKLGKPRFRARKGLLELPFDIRPRSQET